MLNHITIGDKLQNYNISMALATCDAQSCPIVLEYHSSIHTIYNTWPFRVGLPIVTSRWLPQKLMTSPYRHPHLYTFNAKPLFCLQSLWEWSLCFMFFLTFFSQSPPWWYYWILMSRLICEHAQYIIDSQREPRTHASTWITSQLPLSEQILRRLLSPVPGS